MENPGYTVAKKLDKISSKKRRKFQKKHAKLAAAKLAEALPVKVPLYNPTFKDLPREERAGLFKNTLCGSCIKGILKDCCADCFRKCNRIPKIKEPREQPKTSEPIIRTQVLKVNRPTAVSKSLKRLLADSNKILEIPAPPKLSVDSLIAQANQLLQPIIFKTAPEKKNHDPSF